ncbi:hypothetical protein [Nitrospirillum viridazoti]|uniref:Uncharacterized protein n=1 Tax=Nitrospirillum viridazoti CBAmc TaxID=1441467 RepID=A0A248K1H3_9PROT|nr:hypothetical protein [Nitrospirillum amazonense]ASG24284.1 hypothetical protein Y958_25610 [Nitrospirillum amazonense CBAmc]TWB40705.1 hypothetical protein FBZ91_10460 [Nitrospirillum amazonense]
MRILKIFLAALVVFFPINAFAYTECTVNVVRIWIGSGDLYIHYAQGAAVIPSSNTDRDALLALATTAFTAGRSITIRFQADGVVCTSAGARSDVWGIYLNPT